MLLMPAQTFFQRERCREGKSHVCDDASPLPPKFTLTTKNSIQAKGTAQHLWSLLRLNLDAVTKSLRRQIFRSWLKCPEVAQLLGWGVISSQPPWRPARGAGEEEKMVLTSQSYCSHFLLHPTCTERREKSRKLQQAMGKTRIPAGEEEEGRVVRALSIPKQSEHMADTFRLSWKHVAWSWTSWSTYGDDFLPSPVTWGMSSKAYPAVFIFTESRSHDFTNEQDFNHLTWEGAALGSSPLCSSYCSLIPNFISLIWLWDVSLARRVWCKVLSCHHTFIHSMMGQENWAFHRNASIYQAPNSSQWAPNVIGQGCLWPMTSNTC